MLNSAVFSNPVPWDPIRSWGEAKMWTVFGSTGRTDFTVYYNQNKLQLEGTVLGII